MAGQVPGGQQRPNIAPPAPGVQPRGFTQALPRPGVPPAPGVQPRGGLGRYVGNPNHIAQQQAVQNPNHPMYVPPKGGIAPVPTNINSLAAQGIQAAGLGTAAGMAYTPSQVGVAGTSASVNPTNVAGSNVNAMNVAGSSVNPALNNVTGSNVNTNYLGSNVTPTNVSGTNVNAALNNVAGSNVAGSNIAAQQVGQQNASPQVMAQQLLNANINAYQNPYTDQVVKANETDILRGANMGLDMLGAQAQAAGGFGGSRHGVAMGEMGRGVAQQLAQSSAGLRQAGFQNAQAMAGQDIANNFQSQMANQAGSQFDINTNMQRQLANQGAGLQASQANQQNAIQAGLSNQQNALQAAGMNQSAGMQGQLANQQNALQAAGMNQSAGMQGQLANQANRMQALGMGQNSALANQQNALQSQGMNQQYGMQGQLANQGNALQAGLANQSANMQAGLANQGNALQAGGMNQQYNMQGQMANQSAGMQDIQNQLQASLANQNAGLQGNQLRLGAANQLGQLSNLGFGMGQQVNNNLAQQGAQQQAMQQALMQAAQAQFQGFQNHGAQGIGYVNQALGQTPNVGTTTKQETKQNGIFDYLTAMTNSYSGGA